MTSPTKEILEEANKSILIKLKADLNVSNSELELAKKCDGETCYNIGKRYHDAGQHMKAVLWFYKAEAKNPDAQYMIGEMIESGILFDADVTRASEWYKKASVSNNRGHARAEYKLGCLYLKGGVGLDIQPEIAHSWFLKAAEKGDPEAQFRIGSLYATGQGIKTNYIVAMEYYLRAANQDNSDALYHIGILFENGLGVKQDSIKALEWYQRSFERGNAAADSKIKELNRQGYYLDTQKRVQLFMEKSIKALEKDKVEMMNEIKGLKRTKQEMQNLFDEERINNSKRMKALETENQTIKRSIGILMAALAQGSRIGSNSNASS